MSSQAARRIPALIGFNLKAARERRELTQHELALAVGTQAMQVSRWERGAHRPNDETLHALAEALGLTYAEFFVEPEDLVA